MNKLHDEFFSARPAEEVAPTSGMDRQLTPSRWPQIVKWSILAISFFGLVGYLIYQLGEGTVYQADGRTIEVSSVKSGIFRSFITINATLEAENVSVVAAQVDGTVEEIHVRNGDFVSIGTPILTLRNPKLDLEVSKQKALIEDHETNSLNQLISLESERITHEKTSLSLQGKISSLKQDIANKQYLVDKEHINQSQLTSLRVSLAQAERELKLEQESFAALQKLRTAQRESTRKKSAQYASNLEHAKQALDEATVRAEKDGQITGLNMLAGAQTNAGMKIAEIQSVDEKIIRAAVDEYYLTEISVGQNAELQFAGQTVQASLVRIDPNVLDGKFKVEWKLQGNQLKQAKIGQMVRVKHFYSDSGEALLLPMGPFYRSKVGDIVYVVSGDSTAMQQPVSFGRRNETHIEVLAGLQAGDQVITSDYSLFRQADRIQIE